MKYGFVFAAALISTAAAFGAEQTWTGQISDSACNKKHEEAAEGQGKMPDRDCTLACVRGGSLFVFVSDPDAESDRELVPDDVASVLEAPGGHHLDCFG